jgi:hypothetical protein
MLLAKVAGDRWRMTTRLAVVVVALCTVAFNAHADRDVDAFESALLIERGGD